MTTLQGTEKPWCAGQMRSAQVAGTEVGTEVGTAVGSQAPTAGDCGGLPGRPALPARVGRRPGRRRGQGTAGACVRSSSAVSPLRRGVLHRPCDGRWASARGRPPRWLGGRCMPLLRARGGHREHPPLVRNLTAAGSKVCQGETPAPGRRPRIGQGGPVQPMQSWFGSAHRCGRRRKSGAHRVGRCRAAGR